MKAILIICLLIGFSGFGQITIDEFTSETGAIWHGINSGKPAYYQGEPYTGEAVKMNGDMVYEKWNFTNGLQSGEQFRYGPDGRVSTKYIILAGKKHGECISYYFKSDQIEKIEHYDHGVKHGEFLSYYRDGQLSSQKGYLSGKKHGEFLGYYESGQLREQMTWDNNKVAGDEVFYNEDGTIQRKRIFEDGKFTACEGDC